MREAVRDPGVASMLGSAVAFSNMDRQVREVGERLVGKAGERGDGVARQHHRDAGGQGRSTQLVEQGAQPELAPGSRSRNRRRSSRRRTGVATSYAATTG